MRPPWRTVEARDAGAGDGGEPGHRAGDRPGNGDRGTRSPFALLLLPALETIACLVLWQGGGVMVNGRGMANFSGCSIYNNNATNISFHTGLVPKQDDLGITG